MTYDPIARMNAGKDLARERGSTGGTNYAKPRKASDHGPIDELEYTLGLAQAYLDDFIVSMQERSALMTRDDWDTPL